MILVSNKVCVFVIRTCTLKYYAMVRVYSYLNIFKRFLFILYKVNLLSKCYLSRFCGFGNRWRSPARVCNIIILLLICRVRNKIHSIYRMSLHLWIRLTDEMFRHNIKLFWFIQCVQNKVCTQITFFNRDILYLYQFWNTLAKIIRNYLRLYLSICTIHLEAENASWNSGRKISENHKFSPAIFTT